MRLDELLRQPQSLPVVPELAAKLIQTFEFDEVDFDALARDIEHDPVLTARLLRQANSSFFALLNPVGTVREAIVVLGLNKVRALVIAAALNASFHAVSGIHLDKFWHFSFAAATVARLLCTPRRLDANLAFTAALLHGVGELVLHMGMPEAMASLNRRLDGVGELVLHMGMPEAMASLNRRLDAFALERAAVERLALGYSYAEAGAALAQHWRLPRLLVTAIAQHTEPLAPAEQEPLAAVVHLASWRARLLLAGNRANELIDHYPDDVGEALGLDPDLLVAPDVAGLDRLPAL
ncbi:MAG: hypothetical protein B7Y96_06510 [Comamonadaceae bacterium 32-67-11]|nr:MAG: hypothetical protein B7Y96_06510 [Comamonadaceae bacterium 32-67-11]